MPVNREKKMTCCRRLVGFTILVTALSRLTTGCTDSSATRPPTVDGAAGSDGSDGETVLTPPAGTGLASVNNDTGFQTTSISILDPNGGVIHPDCIDSNPPNGGVIPLISTDVVMPSQPQRGGRLVLIDRGNGVLTSVDPATCQVVSQNIVPGAGGARTNPHDLVTIADHKAYVTRYQPNGAATSPAQMGNDIAVIDPTSGAFVSRIDVDAYASAVAGATILARPNRAIIAGGKIVVSLNEADASYKTYGDGQVIMIDPVSDTVVASVTLPGLHDCDGLDYVASTQTLLVACGGTYMAANQSAQSGIAVVDLGASPPSVTAIFTGASFGNQPVNFSWVLAAPPAGGGTRAFAATNDPNLVARDVLFAFDYVLGTATQIATSDPFTVGPPATTGPLLFVPEFLGSTPRVQLFDITSTPQATTAFVPDSINNLSPVQVAWY
jgi:hypothetical protein